MEPEARYTAIGAMIIVLVLLLAAVAAWLGHNGPRTEVHRYTVYFEHQSLQGLQVGSGVDMRGVQVGHVESVRISRDNINRVRVTLKIEGSTPVSDNTVAVAQRKILTGLARIDLQTPGAPGRELTQVPAGEEYPVIAEGTSDLEQIGDAFNRLAVNGTAALAGVKDLLQERNRNEMMATLASAREMSRSIARAAGDLGRSAERVSAAATAISTAAQPTAEQAITTLRDVSRAANSIDRQFNAAAQQLSASAETIARSAERLDDPRAALFGPNPRQLGPGETLP